MIQATPTAVPVLSPAALAPAARQSAEELVKAGTSINTTRSYAAAMRYWCAWYLARYHMTLTAPVPAPAVVQFIVDHVERKPDGGDTLVWDLPPDIDAQLVKSRVKAKPGPMTLSTLEHRLAVLSHFHQRRTTGAEKTTNPCDDALVRNLMKSTRRAAHKRGVKPRKKTAATLDVLNILLERCAGERLIDCRDQALLLFGWSSGGRRRSEISNLTVDRLERVNESLFAVSLGATKTNQDGKSASPDKPLKGKAARAMSEWLRRSGVKNGPVFRQVRGTRVGGRLSDRGVAEVIKKIANRPPRIEGNWGGHSLRSGFVTEAGRSKATLSDTMGMTDHRSVKTVIGYQQAGNLAESVVATLADG